MRPKDAVAGLVSVASRQTCLVQRFFEDDGFNFATLIALGAAYRGLADVGEVLSTIERIPEGDREAWVTEFGVTA